MFTKNITLTLIAFISLYISANGQGNDSTGTGQVNTGAISHDSILRIASPTAYLVNFRDSSRRIRLHSGDYQLIGGKTVSDSVVDEMSFNCYGDILKVGNDSVTIRLQ